jgi:hypothetical protein
MAALRRFRLHRFSGCRHTGPRPGCQRLSILVLRPPLSTQIPAGMEATREELLRLARRRGRRSRVQARRGRTVSGLTPPPPQSSPRKPLRRSKGIESRVSTLGTNEPSPGRNLHRPPMPGLAHRSPRRSRRSPSFRACPARCRMAALRRLRLRRFSAYRLLEPRPGSPGLPILVLRRHPQISAGMEATREELLRLAKRRRPRSCGQPRQGRTG